MRLPPPSTPWYLRPLHGWQRRRHGTVLQPTSLWSHRPGALLAFQALFAALRRRKSPLPLALRTLVSLRVSQLNSCEFCVDLNASMLAAGGIDEDRALAVADWRSDGRFSDSERLALQYAEAMTSTPPDVDEALFRRLQATFSAEAIVELTAVVAFQNMSARFNAALQADSHGFCRLRPAVPAAKSA
jgi:uncharacterized peroxidase-related enzyme